MSIWNIRTHLKLTSGLHIGIGKGNHVTDAPVRRNASGELVIPGRAIGGSLRTLATRLAPRLFSENAICVALEAEAPSTVCNCAVCALFGTVNFRNDTEEGHASPLWVYDAVATSATHIRDGVGIDRRTNTASRNVKFDYEVVSSGTVFELKLRLQPLPEQEVIKLKVLLAATLSEWEAGRGQLGGNVARGLGQFVLYDLKIEEENITSATALVNYLLDYKQTTFRTTTTFDWREHISSFQSTNHPHVAQSFTKISLTLDFTDFFLNNDPLVAMLSGFDHAPLVEFVDSSKVGAPIISGSSLRGALRFHAEKIARTLATLHYRDNPQGFLDNCPACDVLQSSKQLPLASCHERSATEDNDEEPLEKQCLSCQLFGNQRRGSRLWIRDARLSPKKQLDKDDWKVQDFLAIDPFTGGGKDGAKFDAAPLVRMQFKTEIMLHNPSAWELGWLTLLLRDLHEGYLTLGFGAAKGYGRVKAQQVNWSFGWFTEDDLHFMGQTKPTIKVEDKGIYTVSSDPSDDYLPTNWKPVAQSWVAAFNNEVKVERPSMPPQQIDTFFNTPFVELYGFSTSEVTHG